MQKIIGRLQWLTFLFGKIKIKTMAVVCTIVFNSVGIFPSLYYINQLSIVCGVNRVSGVYGRLIS